MKVCEINMVKSSSDSEDSVYSFAWDTTNESSENSESSLDEATKIKMKTKNISISNQGGDENHGSNKKNKKQIIGNKSREKENFKYDKSLSDLSMDNIRDSDEGIVRCKIENPEEEPTQNRKKSSLKIKVEPEFNTIDGLNDSAAMKLLKKKVKEEQLIYVGEKPKEILLSSSSDIAGSSMDNIRDLDEGIAKCKIENLEAGSTQSRKKSSMKIKVEPEFNTSDDGAAMKLLKKKVKEEQLIYVEEKPKEILLSSSSDIAGSSMDNIRDSDKSIVRCKIENLEAESKQSRKNCSIKTEFNTSASLNESTAMKFLNKKVKEEQLNYVEEKPKEIILSSSSDIDGSSMDNIRDSDKSIVRCKIENLEAESKQSRKNCSIKTEFNTSASLNESTAMKFLNKKVKQEKLIYVEEKPKEILLSSSSDIDGSSMDNIRDSDKSIVRCKIENLEAESKQSRKNCSIKIKVEPEFDTSAESTAMKFLNKKVKEEQLIYVEEKPKEILLSSSSDIDGSFMDNTSDSDESIVRNIIERAEAETKQSQNDCRIKIKVEPEFDTNNSLNESAALKFLNKKVKEEQSSYVEEKPKERLLSSSQVSDLFLNDVGALLTESKNSKKTQGKKGMKRKISFAETLSTVKQYVDNETGDNVMDHDGNYSDTETNQNQINKNRKYNDNNINDIKRMRNNGIKDECSDNDSFIYNKFENISAIVSPRKSKITHKSKVKNESESKSNKKKIDLVRKSSSSEDESFRSSHKSKIQGNNNVSNLSNGEVDEISAILPCNDTGINHNYSDSDSSEKSKIPKKSILKNNNDVRFQENSDIENTLLDNTFETYQKFNPYLKPIANKLPKGAIINDDDEVWVLNLPHDITIDMLKNKKISIDNKCKIKLNNDTYVGSLDTTINKSNLLTTKNNKNVIKHKRINGCIKLYKRLPKVRMAEEDGDASQNSVIPLPVTKCRHPLFGYNYETSMIIPPSIKERLDENPMSSKKYKKKRKKKIEQAEALERDTRLDNVKSESHAKRELVNYDSEEQVEIKIEKKKNKKRKLSKDIYDEDGEHVVKKKKYNEVTKWDNAEAIEETLFNS